MNRCGRSLLSACVIAICHFRRIPDYAFMLGDRTLLAALHELGHMPLLVMAARMCPPGVEATMFATLMSVSNLAQFVSEVSSAALTSAMAVTAADMSRLWLLVAVCSATQLVPLPLIPLIPSQLDRPTPALCTRPLSGVELARRGQNDAGEVGEGRVSSELQAAAGA